MGGHGGLLGCHSCGVYLWPGRHRPVVAGWRSLPPKLGNLGSPRPRAWLGGLLLTSQRAVASRQRRRRARCSRSSAQHAKSTFYLRYCFFLNEIAGLVRLFSESGGSLSEPQSCLAPFQASED